MNKNLITLDELYKIIKNKGLDKYIISYGYSKRKGKKYYVILRDGLKPVHFGALDYESYEVHKDPIRRENFRKRFKALYEKIKNNPLSPLFWSWNINW